MIPKEGSPETKYVKVASGNDLWEKFNECTEMG